MRLRRAGNNLATQTSLWDLADILASPAIDPRLFHKKRRAILS
jgi:hypothetical protein